MEWFKTYWVMIMMAVTVVASAATSQVKIAQNTTDIEKQFVVSEKVHENINKTIGIKVKEVKAQAEKDFDEAKKELEKLKVEQQKQTEIRINQNYMREDLKEMKESFKELKQLIIESKKL